MPQPGGWKLFHNSVYLPYFIFENPHSLSRGGKGILIKNDETWTHFPMALGRIVSWLSSTFRVVSLFSNPAGRNCGWTAPLEISWNPKAVICDPALDFRRYHSNLFLLNAPWKPIWKNNPGTDGEMKKNKMENRRRRHSVRVSIISSVN